MDRRSSSAIIVAAISLASYLTATLIAYISIRLPFSGLLPFLGAGMSLPGILLGAALTTDADRSYIPRGILFSSIFWLSAGALIGAFLKDRLRAIIVWAALTAITNVAAVIGWSVLIALAPD